MKENLTITGGILLIAAIIAGIILMWNDIINNIEQDEKRLASTLGTEIIIKNDTLTVIDYDLWDNELCLDNGLTIDYNFYKTLKQL